MVGDIIGLHDASWRSNFGASFYVYGGSHGCVNTPEEAMALIWNLAEDGTPVLMHGANEWYGAGQRKPARDKGARARHDQQDHRPERHARARTRQQPHRDPAGRRRPLRASEGSRTGRGSPTNTTDTAKLVS
ncbi:MAG: L,D-transpeptidase [Acutalibacteraceae bacterium]